MKQQLLAIALAASAAWPGHVAAQDSSQPSLVTEHYGVWVINCKNQNSNATEQESGAHEQRCELRTSVNLRTNQANQRRAVDVIVGPNADNGGHSMLIAVPAEVFLRDPVELRLNSRDDPDAEPKSALELNYVRCLPTNCLSQAGVDEELSALISEAGNAQILFTDLRNQRLAVPLDLTGFADAWTAFQSKGV